MRKQMSMCILLCLLFSLQVQAVSAKSAIVIDGNTGETLFAQNADEQLPMASTTKIMTAITAIESFDLERVYTVKEEYTRVEGSSMHLKAGEQISLRDTLYGLLLMSGNDAALAIAGECGGITPFVQRMNDTAASIGLKQTHFDNPNGLDGDTHYTTARELAMLTAYAMRNEQFRAIVSTQTHQAGGRTMVNHNKMLQLYEDAVGVKTGFTKKSGRCLVSAAERDGRRLIAVTLKAPDDWNDHISMLDTAFAQYKTRTLHEAGDMMRIQPVAGGTTGFVAVNGCNEITASLTDAEYAALETSIIGARFTYAPIRAGAAYGTVQYEVNGAVLAQDDLIFAQSAVLLPEKPTVFERLITRAWGK